MPFEAIRNHSRVFTQRALSSLSEIERRDVQAFDRWFYAGHGWVWLVVIAGVNLGLAGIAAELPWNMSFLEAAVLTNVIVFLLLWSVLAVWFGYRKFHGKVLRYMLLTPLLALIGACVGAGIGAILKGLNPFEWLIDKPQVRHIVVAALVFGFLYSLFTAIIAHLRNREYAALATKLELERRESELSCQLAESRLKMLQLQIEPHFLFNTLGSAQQLAASRAPEAARLIGELICFLRAAIPSMREEYTTLAQEATLVEAYLAIMRVRLGSRLGFSVTIPRELESFSLPPGMLITLVENAIKHGIEPHAPGGEVRVTAVRDDGRVVVTVADTGAGLAGVPGQGIGLANIRERLQLLCGDSGELCLAENEPRGFVARLELPAVMPAAACCGKL
ncbi:MAG TPA: histidine kinase [Casimicrobiaceae bacterium]|nr:histidine kinase [Casimicrobiaceae bacterium]